MPRLTIKSDRASSADPERVVRLNVDDVDQQDNEEVDNQDTPVENTTTTQKRPKQLKLPNFLSSPIDNLANYLGAVSPGIVGHRSRSVGRKMEEMRTEGAAFARNRVQSLDREKTEEAQNLSPQSSRAMKMGALYQVADPFQNGASLDEAATNEKTDETLDDDDAIPNKDADCLIG